MGVSKILQRVGLNINSNNTIAPLTDLPGQNSFPRKQFKENLPFSICGFT